MKATELMVGDYVSVAPSGLPIKIAAIHNKKVGYHYHVTRLEWVRLSLLSPIPLTPEILEKNGFICTQCDDEEIGTYESWSFQSDFITITCEPTLCTLDVFNGNLVKEIKFYTEESTFFVHELQHALKLCKISKEIIL